VLDAIIFQAGRSDDFRRQGGHHHVRSFLMRSRRRLLFVAAYIWRRLLFRTTFIAITGSVGKTQAKECLATILSTQFRTAKTHLNQNDTTGVPLSILRVRPWHRFAVIEIASSRPGSIRRRTPFVCPHIAVVLSVARTHTNNYRSLEEITAEKASLLDALPKDGLAILNADDMRVREMVPRSGCRVKTFGREAGSELLADEVSSKWPDKLTLRVRIESEVEWVKTRLVGEHWLYSVLAALSVALSCGIRLENAVAALGQVEPFPGRMQPVTLPSGAIMLRDEQNGSVDTLKAALQVLEESEAKRRVLVMSDVTDWYKESNRTRVRVKELGRIAARAADLVVFVGEHAHYGVKAAISSGIKPEFARNFVDLYRAADYLKSELRGGDLVLLRGRATDHLSRIFFAQFGTIGCWKTKCKKRILCDHCEKLEPEFELQSVCRLSEELQVLTELESPDPD
jgi:UDP-N-acetylmuramoyl-tripeptide--D-alanyl-D-alanine ligase